MTSSSAAPIAAIIAGGTPAKNPPSTIASTTTGFFGSAPCRNSGADTAASTVVRDRSSRAGRSSAASPVHEQAHDRDRPERADEVDVADPGQRADQHVLRVAGDRRDAADVRRRRYRDHVRHRPAGRGGGPAGSTNGVITRQTTSLTRNADSSPLLKINGRQQVMRVQPDDNPLGDPVEEADDPQVPGHQHHREQQDDGGEVDRAERLAGADDTKGHHQHGADDRRARPIDPHPGELAEREDQ